LNNSLASVLGDIDNRVIARDGVIHGKPGQVWWSEKPKTRCMA